MSIWNFIYLLLSCALINFHGSKNDTTIKRFLCENKTLIFTSLSLRMWILESHWCLPLEIDFGKDIWTLKVPHGSPTPHQCFMDDMSTGIIIDHCIILHIIATCIASYNCIDWTNGTSQRYTTCKPTQIWKFIQSRKDTIVHLKVTTNQ